MSETTEPAGVPARLVLQTQLDRLWAVTDVGIYWPDTTNVTCNDAHCTAEAGSEDRVIGPPGRRITVGELLDAVDEHVREWHHPSNPAGQEHDGQETR